MACAFSRQKWWRKETNNDVDDDDGDIKQDNEWMNEPTNTSRLE